MADQTSGGYLSPWLKIKRLSKVAHFVHGQVLDYGCGTGDLLMYCQPASYTGYDLDSDSIRIAQKKYPQYEFTVDFSSMQRMEKKFDVIVMAAVIEHLENPFDVLAHLVGMLTPTGRLVITTPHPRWRRFHDFGARLGFFSREASEDHKTFLDNANIFLLCMELELNVLHVELFLLGANQLFILGRE